MKVSTSIHSVLVALTGATCISVGCDVAHEREPGAFPEDAQRSPIGKADAPGSCDDACGGQSVDGCWCDDECEALGDCCNDKAAACRPEPEPEPEPGLNQHVLLGIGVHDHLALGGDPIYVLEYEFGEDGLGKVEISCDEATATTSLNASFAAETLRLDGGDFYCFRLDALVNDLTDLTSGHGLPSFVGEGAPSVHFDISNEGAIVEIELLASGGVALHHRNSDAVLQFGPG